MAKLKYDLYITHGTTDSDGPLVLVKFPAMRSQFDTSADRIHLEMKPKSMQLRIDIKLDPSSSSYCTEQAHALAGKSIPKTFTEGQVNRNSFSSSNVSVENDQLFVCKVIDDRLMCCPVSHILTMRSDFSHFDLKEEVDIKEEVRPVSVKFAGPDRQNAPSRSYNCQQENDPSDEYQPLNFKCIDSRCSSKQRVLLFGQQMPKVKPDPDAESIDKKPDINLIPDIKPKIERMDLDDLYSDETMGQRESRTSHQIKQLVKECLLKAKLVSFEEIHQFIRLPSNSKHPSNYNNKDVLDALNECALLVQGNWAVKSELLYGDSSERDCTDVTGVSINLFIAARDYLLWLFTQDRLVNRKIYTSRVRLPDHDVLELFNQLATFKSDIRRWELKLPSDVRFIEKFPDIVQRHVSFWKVRRANKLSIFDG